MDVENKSCEPTAICTICGNLLYKIGGPPWYHAGTEGLPVCRGACVTALSAWKK